MRPSGRIFSPCIQFGPVVGPRKSAWKGNALFFMYGHPSATIQRRENQERLKRRSRASELHAAAEMRLRDYLTHAIRYTGTDLEPAVRADIDIVINSVRKTYRYMLFVGLLVAVTDSRLHPRCLQLKAKCEGAFDARSLCKQVVVPFEKTMLKGRLGGSCDPYVSNPARLPMVEKGNDVKGALDRDHLFRLYGLLERAKTADMALRKKMFLYAYAQVLNRPATETSVAEFDVVNDVGLTPSPFFEFLASHTQGASAVATVAAFFRRFYGKGAEVKVHPLTESGASSNEVGDIDLLLKDGRSFAVEVKDKPYGDVDVHHACEKALAAGVRRVVFAFGPGAEKARPSDGALIGFWAEKGVEVTFLSIASSLGVAMAVSDALIRCEMANAIAEALHEMNAPDAVKNRFRELFNKGAA